MGDNLGESSLSAFFDKYNYSYQTNNNPGDNNFLDPLPIHELSSSSTRLPSFQYNHNSLEDNHLHKSMPIRLPSYNNNNSSSNNDNDNDNDNDDNIPEGMVTFLVDPVPAYVTSSPTRLSSSLSSQLQLQQQSQDDKWTAAGGMMIEEEEQQQHQQQNPSERVSIY